MERAQSKRNNRFLLKCAEIQRKHWFLTLVLIKLSALWFSLIVAYLGNDLGLTTVKDTTKILTFRGWIFTILIAVIVLLGECSLKYEGTVYDDREAYKEGYKLLGNLVLKLSKACVEKRTTLMGVIHRIKTGQESNSIRIVSDPINQIKVITNEINDCLCYFLRNSNGEKWRYQDLYVSIIYNYSSENNKWYWATEEKGLPLESLLGNSDPQSTMKHLMSVTENCAFFNSKEDANKAGNYIPDEFDEYDEEGKLLGSIACFERHLRKSDKEYIHYILSISSYSQRFSIDNSKSAISTIKHNIKELIINDFIERIDIELCLLYLDYLAKDNE